MTINNSVLLSLVAAGRRAILPLAGEPLSITIDSLAGFLSLKRNLINLMYLESERTSGLVALFSSQRASLTRA